MLDTAVDIRASSATEQLPKSRPATGSRLGILGYSVLVILLAAGWLLSDAELVDPADGLGYWLGIVGGSLMLLLLLYPTGKKSKLMRRLGLAKHWFRVHLIIGLVGPTLILYHCNFSVDATNSKVALYSMLVVALSGIIGKHIYTRIHRGLFGRRASIKELRNDISDALNNSRGLAAVLPNSVSQLHAVSEELLGDDLTNSLSMKRSLSWMVKYYVVRVRLHVQIRRELRARGMISDAVRTNARQLRTKANAYAAEQIGLMRQLAQVSFYERLFSIWHMFHMPLFLVLVISALVHVLAVHMY